jgi:hypothetical protein
MAEVSSGNGTSLPGRFAKASSEVEGAAAMWRPPAQGRSWHFAALRVDDNSVRIEC